MAGRARTQRGFTVLEIIIVVVMLGIMASLAIPKILGPNERIRAGEGIQILASLLAAQKSYALDHNGAYESDINDINFDVTIPGSSNFTNIAVANNANAVASVERNINPNAYTLSISESGVITCAPAAACAAVGACKGRGTVCN